MAQKSMAFCLPWIPHILNVHCIPSKIDLGIEAYCWQSRTAGGLVEHWKIAARLQNHCNPFCGVSLQALVLYSCAGRKYRELQDGIVKVRFRKKVEEPSDDTNMRNSVSHHVFSSGFGKQVCWTKKSVHMQRLIKAVASHGHRLLELHEAGQTEPGSHCLKSLPHDLLPTSSSDRKAILLKSWAVGFSVEWQMWGPLAPDKMDGMFQSGLGKEHQQKHKWVRQHDKTIFW